MTATHTGRNLVRFDVFTSPIRSYLETVATVADTGTIESVASLARVELLTLATMAAGIVARHAPDENGRCRVCRTGWTRRPVQAPCAELLCIRGHLKVDGHDHRTRILRKLAEALGVTW